MGPEIKRKLIPKDKGQKQIETCNRSIRMDRDGVRQDIVDSSRILGRCELCRNGCETMKCGSETHAIVARETVLGVEVLSPHFIADISPWKR